MFSYLQNIILFFSLLTLFFPISAEINPTKQEMWDSMSNEVSHWVDGAGYPIDAEIKETVVALNLMGIETISSCEGHFDHGSMYPWVGIQIYPSEVKEMLQEFLEIGDQIDNEETLLRTKLSYLSFDDSLDIPQSDRLITLNKKLFLISESIKQVQIRCLDPLNQLLNEFYENHKTSYDNTLVIQHDSYVFLHSIGADRQHIRSYEEQNQKLIEYRNEMKAFTAFLKKKFLNSN